MSGEMLHLATEPSARISHIKEQIQGLKPTMEFHRQRIVLWKEELNADMQDEANPYIVLDSPYRTLESYGVQHNATLDIMYFFSPIVSDFVCHSFRVAALSTRTRLTALASWCAHFAT